ncbi:MAG: response regulator [Clostridia bacterium]|nr:response regulator [Clostridia bacterium]
MPFVIYSLVYLGSLLMVFNIIGFIRFARYVSRLNTAFGNKAILRIPIVLLVLFLLGYLAVGIFGKPDIIMSGILFGGSVFVFVMYLLLFRITRRIVESEKIESQLKAAEESNRVKTSFLSSVSHEMRTPMNIIIGLDTVALGDPDVPPKTREKLEKIGLSAKHLMGLINNILDINRIESGELEPKREVFPMKSAIDQVSAIFGTLCEEKGLGFRVVGAENVDRAFTGDEMLIKQVLISMLDNAVKYTDAPGSVKLVIGADPTDDGKTAVTFRVMDTGVGIDKSFLPHVFEVFTQENQSSTTRHGGSGLGMAMAKRIVGLMGGEVSVESEKNVGTTFSFTVPLEEASEDAAPSATDGGVDSLAGRRILIVEDIPDNAEIVADLLELEDALSEHAENGRVAVDMFSASEPGYYDAILMDLRMPVMDGLTATRAIRELDREDAKKIPIIALTANAFASDIGQALTAGMNAHLSKPADSELLYSTLKTYIGRA